jgi:hypothetical protein
MIDDLLDGFGEDRVNNYVEERRIATAAALALCPLEIKDWLIQCTSDESGPHSNKDIMTGDSVEWFEVGHNASHYFTLGVRGDGVLIQRVSGPEFDDECQCWYDKTTVKIIEPDQVPYGYWGHQ